MSVINWSMYNMKPPCTYGHVQCCSHPPILCLSLTQQSNAENWNTKISFAKGINDQDFGSSHKGYKKICFRGDARDKAFNQLLSS